MTTNSHGATGADDVLINWLAGLSLGKPASNGPLALVPVFGPQSSAHAHYRTLSAAINAGDVEIAEQEHPTVPLLRLVNNGVLPVLVLDGEEVVGGDQNRVMNTTVLIPAKVVFELPVRCIEHGRWFEASDRFEPGEAVHPFLRLQKNQQVTASLRAWTTPAADQQRSGSKWTVITDAPGRGQPPPRCGTRTCSALTSWRLRNRGCVTLTATPLALSC